MNEETMNNFFSTTQNIESLADKSTDAKSSTSIPKGTVKSKVYGDYYDISDTIDTALASDPNNFDDAAYNRERIFVDKERLAERVLVSNDGTDTLFVVISHSSELSMSKEVPIYTGEIKTYYNVYEIRLRSPTAGTAYRVMEYELNQNSSSGQYLYSNITLAAPTTTIVKLGSGFLHAIIINNAAVNGVITIYDNTNGSGTIIGTITSPAVLLQSQIILTYNVKFTTGLTIVTTTAAQDITVSYR